MPIPWAGRRKVSNMTGILTLNLLGSKWKLLMDFSKHKHMRSSFREVDVHRARNGEIVGSASEKFETKEERQNVLISFSFTPTSIYTKAKNTNTGYYQAIDVVCFC
eukprot:m.200590 g.200590  ORF g.200590 m.200590 type:complete len:106 (-) comp32771_c1_seq2:637-954(-)